MTTTTSTKTTTKATDIKAFITTNLPGSTFSTGSTFTTTFRYDDGHKHDPAKLATEIIAKLTTAGLTAEYVKGSEKAEKNGPTTVKLTFKVLTAQAVLKNFSLKGTKAPAAPKAVKTPKTPHVAAPAINRSTDVLYLLEDITVKDRTEFRRIARKTFRAAGIQTWEINPLTHNYEVELDGVGYIVYPDLTVTPHTVSVDVKVDGGVTIP